MSHHSWHARLPPVQKKPPGQKKTRNGRQDELPATLLKLMKVVVLVCRILLLSAIPVYCTEKGAGIMPEESPAAAKTEAEQEKQAYVAEAEEAEVPGGGMATSEVVEKERAETLRVAQKKAEAAILAEAAAKIKARDGRTWRDHHHVTRHDHMPAAKKKKLAAAAAAAEKVACHAHVHTHARTHVHAHARRHTRRRWLS